jgi:small subunit ribosomal protein S2
MINNFLLNNISKTISSSIHLGHESIDWNPKICSYLVARNRYADILNFRKIKQCLEVVGDLFYRSAKHQKSFLFVGVNTILKNSISSLKNCYYIENRWPGGLASNWLALKKRINHFCFLEKQLLLDIKPKKLFYKIRKEHKNLIKDFEGIKKMKSLPDFVIFLSAQKYASALMECKNLGLSTTSLVDTDSDPELTSYPIPCNDNSISVTNYIIKYMFRKIKKGQLML